MANGHAMYSQGLCPQQRRTLNQSGFMAVARAERFGNDIRALESFPALPSGGSSLISSSPQKLKVPYSLAVHVDGEGTDDRVVSFQNGIWLDLPRILPSDTPGEAAIAMTLIGDSSLSVTKWPNMKNLDGSVNKKTKTVRAITTECATVAHNSKVMMVGGGKIADILGELEKYAEEYGIGQTIPGQNSRGEQKDRVSIAPREQIVVIKIHGNDAVDKDGAFCQPGLAAQFYADKMADILKFIPNHIVEINYGGALYGLPEQYDSAMLAIAHRL